MASVASYRGYTSADSEINLVSYSMGKSYSPRGKKLTETRRVRLHGELIYSTPELIMAAATNVVNAFSQNGGDFRYTVGGTIAHSLLNSSDCQSGVRVVNTSFPNGDPAQLATTRTFTVDLEATYDSCDDELVSWTETVEVVGTGGPYFVCMESVIGPRLYYMAPSTAQYFTQSGRAVGYRNYPDTPGPVNPAGEFGFRRRITETGGRQTGNGLRFFTKGWTYHMVRDPAAFGFGDFHPTSR